MVMPAAVGGLGPLLTLIFGGASAGASIGSTIYNDVNAPGTPKAAPAPTGPSVDQLKSAVGPQALSIESATGGSVSPDYLSTIAPTLAGAAGQPNTGNAMQQLLQQIFGNKTPTPGGGGAAPSFTPSGLTPNLTALAATPGASDFLSKIASGGS